MLVKLKHNYVQDEGRASAIDKPLIKPAVRPIGGWGSAIFHNGVQVSLNGVTPKIVYERLEKFCDDNDLSFDVEQLWATLNLDWMGRVESRQRLFSMSSLLEAIEDDPCGITADWIKPVMNSIGFYLSVRDTSFQPTEFASFARIAISIADPVARPRTGSLVLWGTLLEIRGELWQKPVYTVEEARSWFMSVYRRLLVFGDLDSMKDYEFKKLYRWTS